MAATGIGVNNPGHENSTHLINFAPEIGPKDFNNPVWGNGPNVNGDVEGGKGQDTNYKGPGCNLRCHNFEMKHNYIRHSVGGGSMEWSQ